MHTLINRQNENTGTSAIRFDSDGYLLDRYDWSKTLADKLAGNEGIKQLTEEHWQVIQYIRNYFNRLNTMPPPRRICRQLGIQGHDIKAMFGSCLTVWRIAGLPNPGDEARAHMH